jgi:pantoate--beta-alanine ligase
VEIVRAISEMREAGRALRADGGVLAFVPTMGFLHEGHASLIRIAAGLADSVVVSVFVNPTQFGPGEDYERYPRDLAGDARVAEAAGCDFLFAPSADEMYPRGHATVVHVERMGEKLCGAFRPGHFDGVCTVVAKLLEIVRPSVTVFGQKDGQQAAIIERMIEDLHMDVALVRGPTAREPDGLAMSSRNSYLAPDERADAAIIYRALGEARRSYEEGERDAGRVLDGVRSAIASRPTVRLQYAEAVDWRTLDGITRLGPGTMLAVAAFVGETRLIDNIVLEGGGPASGAVRP